MHATTPGPPQRSVAETPSKPAPAPEARTSDTAQGLPCLDIQPGGWRLPVAPGQTLLMAAMAGGVRLPASCRNGTCRSCIGRLLHGQVRYLIDWPGLLAEERAEGWVLPCVATADADVVIHAPGAQAG